MILNPAMECMDRESMTKLQSERLVATVKRCYENVPFYRKKMDKMGIKPEDIKVIATGGMATMVESGVDCIDIIDRRLTLNGLQILYEKNKGLHKKRVLQSR